MHPTKAETDEVFALLKSQKANKVRAIVAKYRLLADFFSLLKSGPYV
jgi:hypothetical protein